MGSDSMLGLEGLPRAFYIPPASEPHAAGSSGDNRNFWLWGRGECSDLQAGPDHHPSTPDTCWPAGFVTQCITFTLTNVRVPVVFRPQRVEPSLAEVLHCVLCIFSLLCS